MVVVKPLAVVYVMVNRAPLRPPVRVMNCTKRRTTGGGIAGCRVSQAVGGDSGAR